MQPSNKTTLPPQSHESSTVSGEFHTVGFFAKAIGTSAAKLECVILSEFRLWVHYHKKPGREMSITITEAGMDILRAKFPKTTPLHLVGNSSKVVERVASETSHLLESFSRREVLEKLWLTTEGTLNNYWNFVIYTKGPAWFYHGPSGKSKHPSWRLKKEYLEAFMADFRASLERKKSQTRSIGRNYPTIIETSENKIKKG